MRRQTQARLRTRAVQRFPYLEIDWPAIQFSLIAAEEYRKVVDLRSVHSLPMLAKHFNDRGQPAKGMRYAMAAFQYIDDQNSGAHYRHWNIGAHVQMGRAVEAQNDNLRVARVSARNVTGLQLRKGQLRPLGEEFRRQAAIGFSPLAQARTLLNDLGRTHPAHRDRLV